MVEYKTVSSGMRAADIMVKTAEVEIIEATTVCPGKYMVLISGELSAVRASVDAAAAKMPDMLIDKFVLGNPHDSIFTALYGTTDIGSPNALGVLETFSSCAAIVAADIAAKTYTGGAHTCCARRDGIMYAPPRTQLHDAQAR